MWGRSSAEVAEVAAEAELRAIGKDERRQGREEGADARQDSMEEEITCVLWCYGRRLPWYSDYSE
jgi:hypothetical protein